MQRIDQLVRGRRRFAEDAQPTERVDPVVSFADVGRNAASTHALRAVAADHKVGGKLHGCAGRVEVADPVKKEFRSAMEPRTFKRPYCIATYMQAKPKPITAKTTDGVTDPDGSV